MNNDYGVSKQNLNGTVSWVTQESPLETGSESDAINSWTYAEACAVATYLTNMEGAEFAPGRPKDRQPS